MNELLNGILGDEFKKYLPIIIVVVIVIIIYLMNQKGNGIMDILKDFPISSLLGDNK